MWRSVLGMLFTCLSVCCAGIPFLTKKQKYTPLLFFKGAHGSSPENDAMEKCVAEVEKELGVKVQRLDINRDPLARVSFAMLATGKPPLLYHRESRQTISLDSGEDDDFVEENEQEDEKDKKPAAPVHVDKNRVRAWAKGRYVPPPQVDKKGAPIVAVDEDAAMDQAELLDDPALSPLQREGKRAIRESTEEEAEARKERLSQ